MFFAQLIISPAGSGKSTYCSSLCQHCEAMWRAIHIVSLDPAAENFDYPVAMGQIEIFSHVPVLRNFVEHLKRKNFNVFAVHLLDSQFIADVTKFNSGWVASLSAMVQLELPHVNILSKMDLLKSKRDFEDYLNPEPQFLLSELNQRMAPQYGKLNKALIELVDEYSMMSFLPLDLRKESQHSIYFISNR